MEHLVQFFPCIPYHILIIIVLPFFVLFYLWHSFVLDQQVNPPWLSPELEASPEALSKEGRIVRIKRSYINYNFWQACLLRSITSYQHFLEVKMGYVRKMKCYPLYKRTQRQKPHDYFIRCWESILLNPTPLHDKTLGKIRNSRPIPKHNKSNIQLASSQHQSKWREPGSNPTKIRD